MNTNEKLKAALALINEAMQTPDNRNSGVDSLRSKLTVANRDVYDIVHAINVLAMANTDVIHIFVNFAAHVNWLTVYACQANTDYQEGSVRRRLISEEIRLKSADALEQLISIESKLTELIIAAREDSVTAKEEVEA